MFLGELYDSLESHLSILPFSVRTALAATNDGVDQSFNLYAIDAHMRLGISELCTRFHLKENSLILKLDPTITKYPLISPQGTYYKTINSLTAFASIQDIEGYSGTDQPFFDDVLEVIKIEDYVTEEEIAFNILDDVLAIQTNSNMELTVPSSYLNPPGKLLRVTYRTSRIGTCFSIDDIVANDLKEQLYRDILFFIPIHEAYKELLVYYICWRLLSSLDFVEAGSHALAYHIKYEEAVAKFPRADYFTTAVYSQIVDIFTSRPYSIGVVEGSTSISGVLSNAGTYTMVLAPDTSESPSAVMLGVSLRSIYHSYNPAATPEESLGDTAKLVGGTLSQIRIVYAGALPETSESVSVTMVGATLNEIYITYDSGIESSKNTSAIITGATLI